MGASSLLRGRQRRETVRMQAAGLFERNIGPPVPERAVLRDVLRLQDVEVPEDQAVAASPVGSAAARPSRNLASVWSRDGTYTPTVSRGPWRSPRSRRSPSAGGSPTAAGAGSWRGGTRSSRPFPGYRAEAAGRSPNSLPSRTARPGPRTALRAVSVRTNTGSARAHATCSTASATETPAKARAESGSRLSVPSRGAAARAPVKPPLREADDRCRCGTVRFTNALALPASRKAAPCCCADQRGHPPAHGGARHPQPRGGVPTTPGRVGESDPGQLGQGRVTHERPRSSDGALAYPPYRAASARVRRPYTVVVCAEVSAGRLSRRALRRLGMAGDRPPDPHCR